MLNIWKEKITCRRQTTQPGLESDYQKQPTKTETQLNVDNTTASTVNISDVHISQWQSVQWVQI